MDGQQFLSLCHACDNLLLQADSPPETIAVAWLHIIRDHPVFLAKYSSLYEPETSFRSVVREKTLNLRYAAGNLRRCIRGLSSAGILWHTTEPYPTFTDVLFVSHLLNPSQIGQDQDFYFGSVPADLANNGISTTIALINQTNNLPSQLATLYSRPAVPRLILSNSLSIAEEIGFSRRAAREQQKMRELVVKLPNGLLRSVATRAATEAMSSATTANLRIHHQKIGRAHV